MTKFVEIGFYSLSIFFIYFNNFDKIRNWHYNEVNIFLKYTF